MNATLEWIASSTLDREPQASREDQKMTLEIVPEERKPI